MIINLNNVKRLLQSQNLIKKSRVYGENNKARYKLLESLNVHLSNGYKLIIPKGFVWDASSSPRFLWWLLPPEGDFELASLIHDFLYKKKLKSRSFADKEMLLWSKAINSTKKISLRNIDNYVRYFGVRTFGWLVWRKIIKL